MVSVCIVAAAGSRVKITAWADKMGRTLAFLSMKMEDEDSGQLVRPAREGASERASEG